ncbi:MAG: sugar transferase [Butyrivibrio sp.]|nr:sugar transferase [Butyrivibrio sp.]
MNEKKLAPVAVFGYNRADKIQKCVEALEKCDLASSTELYIFADGYKSDKDRESVEAVHKWAISFEADNHAFAHVKAVVKERNAGLANSIISKTTDLLNKYGKVIVVEDDLIVAPSFLKYMNGALDYYQYDSDIWEIASYGYDLKALRHYKHDVYLSYRASSWGWATWKDRWDTVDWEVSDYWKLQNNKELQKKFCRGGGDLYPMLQRQMLGESDSWAIRWNYAASKQDKLTVYPKYGLVSNKGFDGSGTHTKGHAPEDILNNGTEVKFEKLTLDPQITREFYLLHTDTIDKKIKRNLSFRGIGKMLRRVFKLE